MRAARTRVRTVAAPRSARLPPRARALGLRAAALSRLLRKGSKAMPPESEATPPQAVTRLTMPACGTLATLRVATLRCGS